MNKKHLPAILATILLIVGGTTAFAAKNRQAEKDYKQGMAAELKEDWDTAVTLYQKASDENPTELNYQIAVRRARFQSGQKHVEAGVKLRGENKLPEAIQEFQRAIVIDPSSSVAIQELKRTQQIVLDQRNSNTAGLTEVERIRKEEDQRIASIESPPELEPTERRLPTPTKINQATPQQLYRTIGDMTGVHVVFDPTYQTPGNAKPQDINLDGMTVEQAFDMIAFVTKTFWKPISANTIFVCEDSTTKRRDYEDDVVRVFYVPNASSVQEFVEIANGIRTVTEIRRLFTYNAARAIMVRDTADKVAMVEKLVHDLDKPKSEVIVDVLIMEANTTRSRQLAATIASGGTAGLNVPIAFTPRTSITVGGTSTTTTSSTSGTATTTNPGLTGLNGTTGTTGSTTGAVGLNSLSHLSSADFSTSLPGALLEAMLTDTKTKVLHKPQVRASDGMKAELKVGLRIPYATGSLGSAVGATTAGVSPLVQTQFSYADTGIQLIITPQVHSADELTMHVEITVSSVQQYENLGGGLSQPVIAQEQNTTDVRMRNNEVSLLGGLNQTTQADTLNGIPGLASLPVLGKFLFGSTSTERDSDQILIAMIPHIVRTPDYLPENFRTIFAGNEANPKIVHAPLPDEPVPPAPAAAKPAAMVQPTAPSPAAIPAAASTPPAAPAPIAAPAASPAAPVPPPQSAAPAKTAAEASPPQPGPGPRLSFLPGPIQVKADGSFTLTVQMDGAANMAALSPLHIKFDPAQVRLNDVSAGELLKGGGAKIATVREIRNESGEATLSVTRAPDAGGVTGSGPVAMFNFSAIGRGTGAISIADASVKNTQSQSEATELASVPITVE